MEGKARPVALTGNYLAHLAHELRTPLNVIIGYADAMRGEVCGPLPAPYANYAETIREAGRHMLALAEEMLARAASEAGPPSPAEAFEASEPVAWAVRLLRLEAEAAGVSVTLIPPPAPIRVRGRRRAIAQIVINLVANALRHTPPGGTISIGLAQAGAEFALRVADTGTGFEPGRAGAGLGLRLVEELAAAHGGRVAILSQAGRGATVTVTLPIVEP